MPQKSSFWQVMLGVLSVCHDSTLRCKMIMGTSTTDSNSLLIACTLYFMTAAIIDGIIHCRLGFNGPEDAVANAVKVNC
jgi:hypothetical protein